MSSINPDIVDGLLIKVILREATEQEASLVEGWVRSSESNRLYFEDFKRIWTQAQGLAVESDVDENEAWTRFKTRVNPPQAKIAPIRWARIAAIFLVLAVGGWMYFQYSHKPSLRFALQSDGGTLRDTLQDGTVVTLNKHSSLKGLKYFSKTERTVDLEGEAFFEVTGDKSRPFSVRTKGAVIKVLGTSFNVRNTTEGTEIIVETGQVLVGKESEFVQVQSQERIVVPAGAGVKQKQRNSDELYNYYRTKEFVCNGTSLARLVEVLNAAYGAHIELADSSLGRLQLTTTFQDGSLDEIVGIVRKTLNLDVDRKDGRIIFKKHD